MTFVAELMMKYGNSPQLLIKDICTKAEIQKLNSFSTRLDLQLRRPATIDALKNQRPFKRGKKLGIRESYRYSSTNYAFFNSIFAHAVTNNQGNNHRQNQTPHETALTIQPNVAGSNCQPVTPKGR